MIWVSWEDATAYAEWLSAETARSSVTLATKKAMSQAAVEKTDPGVEDVVGRQGDDPTPASRRQAAHRPQQTGHGGGSAGLQTPRERHGLETAGLPESSRLRARSSGTATALRRHPIQRPHAVLLIPDS